MISETTGCTLALCAAFDKIIYDEEKRLSTYMGFDPGSYVLLPWAPTAGMLLKHFRDEFSGGMDFKTFDAEAAAVAPGSDGLILLPHCAGAVSPDCNPHARGVAWGITLAHKRGHFARAIMESVAYLLKDNVEALRSMGCNIREIRSLGGASKSKLWLQIKADVLNLPVTVTECAEATWVPPFSERSPAGISLILRQQLPRWSKWRAGSNRATLLPVTSNRLKNTGS